MKQKRTYTTMCTFEDDCVLTIRCDEGVVYFELWTPGSEVAEPVATVQHTGARIEWSKTARELLEYSAYGDEIVAAIEDYGCALSLVMYFED